jgi:succinate dehydrogenase / fumarate reductase flavoprotein subunit
VDGEEVERLAQALLEPFDGEPEENPYAIHADLQDCMQDLVGIIRTEEELQRALQELETLKARAARVRVTGNRHYNPAWHLALDLPTMLTVSEACTRSALERRESRGGHTRADYPETDPHLGQVNVVTRRGPDGALILTEEPLPETPAELQQLIEEAH